MQSLVLYESAAYFTHEVSAAFHLQENIPPFHCILLNPNIFQIQHVFQGPIPPGRQRHYSSIIESN